MTRYKKYGITIKHLSLMPDKLSLEADKWLQPSRHT